MPDIPSSSRSARDRGHERAVMVEQQIGARGVRDPAVLRAMSSVPREHFLSEELREFAYHDVPLPIAAEQTISQPYIVALMLEALLLEGHERVLEIGTGSGYAAAVLARIAREVWTIERHPELARKARKALEALELTNTLVVEGDGTLGLSKQAPFDAIVVTAGGPEVPRSLQEQLAIGGRLVIPVGDRHVQRLVRVIRTSRDAYRTDELSPVRFVPLIGEQGWRPPESETRGGLEETLPDSIARFSETFETLDRASLDGFVERVGRAKVVLLGESTHGTSEFYRMRARITRELIERKGFNVVALEADWPDAGHIDRYDRPQTERASHYFSAVLPRQFDEYCWIAQSTAVRPLDAAQLAGVPDTYPFGL